MDKYRKESKFFFRLPPEINLIKSIANKCKSSLTQRTLISEEDKEILSSMIAMNKEHRVEKGGKALRLRDVIIDRMIAFFGLEKELEAQYLSFEDYL